MELGVNSTFKTQNSTLKIKVMDNSDKENIKKLIALEIDKNQIDERCVKIAFEVNEKIQSQSIAYDFVFDKDNNPLIVEISYGYAAPAYDKCEGYWDRDMNWHKGENFDFCGWMIDDLLKS